MVYRCAPRTINLKPRTDLVTILKGRKAYKRVGWRKIERTRVGGGEGPADMTWR